LRTLVGYANLALMVGSEPRPGRPSLETLTADAYLDGPGDEWRSTLQKRGLAQELRVLGATTDEILNYWSALGPRRLESRVEALEAQVASLAQALMLPQLERSDGGPLDRQVPETDNVLAWISANRSALRAYAGKHVAIENDRIVDSDENLSALLDRWVMSRSK